MTRFTGLYPAAYTPFDESGDIRYETLEALAELFREGDARGVFIAGTAGECHSLTVAERIELTRRWVEVAGADFQTLAHVGHNCIPDAVTLAREAARAGATAVSVMPPMFFKPESVDVLIDCCEPIARAAGDLPFFYYHIPELTGVFLSMAEFLERAPARIPTLAGIKFSQRDLTELEAARRVAGDRFDLLLGWDENLIEGLLRGIDGAIGSTFNYALPVYHRIVDAHAAGDVERARAEQAKSVELVDILVELGIGAAGKTLMSCMGVDCGTVRLPLPALTEAQRAQLVPRVEHLDVFTRPLSR